MTFAELRYSIRRTDVLRRRALGWRRRLAERERRMAYVAVINHYLAS